jgi:hypothetical protein
MVQLLQGFPPPGEANKTDGGLGRMGDDRPEALVQREQGVKARARGRRRVADRQGALGIGEFDR